MRRIAAALLLVTLGALASPAAVPIYDGVGAPDEPYKYVGRSSGPVLSVSVSADISHGTSGGLELQTAENGPQLLLDLGEGAFSATTKTVTLTAQAMAGAGSSVPQGTVNGNVYRITASVGSTLLPQQAQGFLFLRAATMTKPDPVIVHRRAETDAWEKVKTVRAGTDILSTPFRDLGDYAVVRLPRARPLSQASGGSSGRLLVLGGGLLLLLVAVVVVIRRRSPGR